MIKFLDLIHCTQTKTWIDDDFSRWLATDGIYHISEKQTIKDRDIGFDFNDKLKLAAEKTYLFDSPHGMNQSGQSFIFTTAEWEEIMNNENYSQWIPFYAEKNEVDGKVSIEATHDSIGDTLYYCVDNRWITYDVTQIRFYEQHLPREEGESDQDYLRRVQAKINQTNEVISSSGMTTISKNDQYTTFEASGYSYVDEYDSIQNSTSDNPLIIDIKEKIKLDFIAIRNNSTTENYSTYLHVISNGIEIHTIRIPAGNSVVSINYKIPGNTKLSFYVTGSNGEAIDILLKYSYVWTSAFRTEVYHKHKVYINDDLSYTLSNDFIDETFMSSKAKSNLYLRDQIIQVV